MGLFGRRSRRRSDEPDQLIDAVITDIRHRLTEARLQVLAADLARKQLTQPQTCHPEVLLCHPERSEGSLRDGISQLESTLRDIESRRDALIARARDADARLAIERALMEVDAEPAQVALDLLGERVSEAQAEADAVAEVRRISAGGDDVG